MAFSGDLCFSTLEAAFESLVPVGELYKEFIREPSLYLLGCLGCLAFSGLAFPLLI